MQLLPWDSLHMTNETPQQKKIFAVKHPIWREMYIDLDYGAVNFQLLFAGYMLYMYFQIIFSLCLLLLSFFISFFLSFYFVSWLK